MDEPDVQAEPFGATFLMHQTRHVGGNDILGAGSMVILNFVVTHFRGDRLLEHRKRAAEATAFIRSTRLDKLDAAHFAQQVERFWRKRLIDF